MSNKRTDRQTASRDDDDDDDDDDEHQPNKSARVDEQSAAPFTVGSSLAAAAASSVSALPPILPSLSPAQRLYSDALISVFGFLDLRGVISAHASCRSWRDAAYKEPSRKITLRRALSKLAWCGASPLRHHVGEYSEPRGPTCTLEQVASLSVFPSLTRVTIEIYPRSLTLLVALQGQAGSAEAIAAAVAQWPSRLTFLRVGLSGGHPFQAVAPRQVLIDCIGRLSTLTELALRLAKGAPASLTLQPLLQLTRLQTLKFNGTYSPDAAGCRVLKQMSSLTHLDIGSHEDFSLEALQALCTPPHQLAALQFLDLNRNVTAAHMEALICLPALSTLSPPSMDPAAAAYLPRFPQLRDLTVSIEHASIDLVLPHLFLCSTLTSLRLAGFSCRLTNLATLGRSLPSLTSLHFDLVTFDGLESPAALAVLRSFPHLRHLSFRHCAGVQLIHLVDAAFTSLPSIRELEVSLSTAELPLARALLTPPCALMPQLTHTELTERLF